MRLQNQKYSEYVLEVVPNQIGYVALFSELTSFYGEYTSRIGERLNCPFPNKHRNGGGHNDFRLFNDFDHTGMAVCSCCDSAYGPFQLLKLAGFHDFSSLLKSISKVLANRNIDKLETTPQMSRPAKNQKNTTEKVAKRRLTLETLRESATRIGPDNLDQCNPLSLYFKNRGIPFDEAIPDGMSFHQATPVYEKEEGKSIYRGTYPTGLFLMTSPDDKPVTYHRVYTTEEGVKPSDLSSNRQILPEVEHGKMLMGSAMRLYSHANEKRIHITEGIEKAHALRLALGPGYNIWATYSAGQLAAFEPPKWCTNVTIWSDYEPYDRTLDRRDRGMPGLYNALKLRKRLKDRGLKVSVKLPWVRDALDKKFDIEDVIVEKQMLLFLPEQARPHLLLESCAPVHVIIKYSTLLSDVN